MRTILAILIVSILFSCEAFASGTLKSDHENAYRYYMQALLADRYGDQEKALDYYSNAIDLDVKSNTLRLKLAVEHIKQGNNENAVKILSELSMDDDVNIDAYLLLILMHSTQGEQNLASDMYVELLQRLYELDKTNLKIAESLAQYNIQIRDIKRAIQIYEEIQVTHPQYEDGIYWLGFLYEEQGEREKAISKWKALLKLNPSHSNALNSLAYIYAEENRLLDEAERMIKVALTVHPESVAYQDTLGWIFFKQEKFDEAKKIIEPVAEKADDPIIMEHLGDIYTKLGENDKALKSLRKAFILDSKNQRLKNKINKLQEGQHDK